MTADEQILNRGQDCIPYDDFWNLKEQIIQNTISAILPSGCGRPFSSAMYMVNELSGLEKRKRCIEPSAFPGKVLAHPIRAAGDWIRE